MGPVRSTAPGSDPPQVRATVVHGRLVVLIDALRRAQVLAADDTPRKRTFYERNLRRLAFLSPDLQRDIVHGRRPIGLTLAKLIAEDPPLLWREQALWLQRLAET